MKRFDPNAKYYEADFWVRQDEELFTIGVTDFGQEFFRNLHTVELPEIGAQMTKGTAFCSVESDKVTTDLTAPVSGEVAEINLELNENANWINRFPYSKGWILKLKNIPKADLEQLSTAEEFVATIKIFFNKE